MRRAARIFVLASAGLLARPMAARAHKPSDSYLSLDLTSNGRSARGTWDVALRDLDYVLALDADGDGALTLGEVRARAAEVRRYALDRVSLTVRGERCALEAGPLGLVEHSDGRYARLPLSIACPSAPGLPGASTLTAELDYHLFFDVDPQHRGIVRLGGAPSGSQRSSGEDPDARSSAAPLILDAHHHRRVVPLVLPAAPPSALPSMVAAGARHIAGGLDHLLFLLALLLPAVLMRGPAGRGWAPVGALRPAIGAVARVVTAFTLAHSVTLTLAALGLCRMPARLVEPAIAASVVIAAANNLWPVFGRDRWAVAFTLGLLHGFGFSSALADGGFSGANLVVALLGFNLGVELGQLALVAAFVPLAFVARRTLAYRRLALGAGSFAIAALALVWFVERSLDLRLLTWSS